MVDGSAGRERSHLFEGLPTAIRDPYEAIWREATRLHFRWALYKQLYGTQERVDLLNEVGTVFFYQLQFIMQDDVMLASARLLDRRKGALTLSYLLDCMEKTTAWRSVSGLRVALVDLVHLGEPFIVHRHGRIAHADIQHHRQSWAPFSQASAWL
jgi:hypothetical protein